MEQSAARLDTSSSTDSVCVTTARGTASDSFLTLSMLSLGFLGFGACVGGLTGFSTAQGISTSLLGSAFGFVGGAVLSFAGFRRVTSGGSEHFDLVRVGLGLGCFSLGMLSGLLLGTYARCNVHAQSFLLGEAVAHSQCVTMRVVPEHPQPGLSAGSSTSSPRERSELFGGAGPMRAGRAECTEALRRINIAIQTEPPTSRERMSELMGSLAATCHLD